MQNGRYRHDHTWRFVLLTIVWLRDWRGSILKLKENKGLCWQVKFEILAQPRTAKTKKPIGHYNGVTSEEACLQKHKYGMTLRT